MQTEGPRTYDVRRDLEGIYDLAEVAYVEDYARIGRSAKAGMERERRVATAVAFLGRAFPKLRDLSQGYVWEADGRIICVVLFARVGLAGNRWSIETVATHPEHRRQGLARRLVERAVETIQDRGGEVCTLKVRADNHAAYELYTDLGFVHFDSTANLRTTNVPRDIPGSLLSTGGAYVERAASPREWFGSWEARWKLAGQEMPLDVQTFLPISQSQFRPPRFITHVAPLLSRLSGRRIEHTLVECRDTLVATLRIETDTTGERTHEFSLCIDPEHEESLAAPLMDKALRSLLNAARLPILTETRLTNRRTLQELEDRGFERVITWHELGLRFPRA